MHIDLTCIN